MKLNSPIFISAMCICGSLPAALAQQGSTQLTLTQTSLIPGASLKAGSYSVRILDRLPDRYVLEVRNSTTFKTISTFLAIPDRSLPRSPEGEPIYWAKRGKTPAVRGMWVAGATEGTAFVFPKAEAAALAKKVGQAVPAVDPDSEGKAAVAKMDEMDRKIVGLWMLSAVAVTPNGSETGIQATKYVAPEPIVASASAPEPPARSAVATKGEVRDQTRNNQPGMPKTAGNFAANLASGILALGTGLVLRRAMQAAR